jgi:PHD/YefM family antitoxin component YafN of YafNO toxin-antitoxin module
MYIAYTFSRKEGDIMRSWSITEARAKISDVFDAALTEGPQKIERRDSEPVVIVAESDWNRLVTEYQTVADLILIAPIEEEDMPVRQPARVITRELF